MSVRMHMRKDENPAKTEKVHSHEMQTGVDQQNKMPVKGYEHMRRANRKKTSGNVNPNRNRGGDFISANGLNHVSPPEDTHRKIQMVMVLAGVGFLLPYNSFMLAVDFYQEKFPDSTIMFDISMVYIITAFFAVLLNNVFVEILSLNTRIIFGYILTVFTLLFVGFVEIHIDSMPSNVGYMLNLIAVGVASLGCTVQQSSYYGYTSMLPTRYTQAVMAGESVAGVWVSMSRIATKIIWTDERQNIEVFFGIAALMLNTCFYLYIKTRKTPFVQFYIRLCQDSRKKITLEPAENSGLMDLESNDPNKSNPSHDAKTEGQTSSMSFEDTIILSGENSLVPNMSFANPVYEPSNKGFVTINEATLQLSEPTYKVEDVIGRPPRMGIRGKTWKGIKDGVRARWIIAQQIYPYMVFITLAYFVTLCLYPGIMSEITSCRFGTWMPIILLTTFNFGDLFGKILAPIVSDWAKSKLAAWCSLRVLLLPLFLMCCVPRGSPHAAAAGDSGPIILSFILGWTGGALGAAPMLAAGQQVHNDARELAGNIMTLSYNFGLTAGSLVAYLLEAMLGPQVPNKCGSVYPTIGSITRALTTSTTVNATLATELATTGVSYLSTAFVKNESLYPTVVTEILYSLSENPLESNSSVLISKLFNFTTDATSSAVSPM